MPLAYPFFRGLPFVFGLPSRTAPLPDPIPQQNPRLLTVISRSGGSGFEDREADGDGRSLEGGLFSAPTLSAARAVAPMLPIASLIAEPDAAGSQIDRIQADAAATGAPLSRQLMRPPAPLFRPARVHPTQFLPNHVATEIKCVPAALGN